MSRELDVDAEFTFEMYERWRRMNLIWSHEVPCWAWKENKHCPCMPELNLVCAFHTYNPVTEEFGVTTSK